MCFVCASSAYRSEVSGFQHIDYKGNGAVSESYSGGGVSYNVEALSAYVPALISSAQWNSAPSRPLTISYSFSAWAASPDTVYSLNPTNFSIAQQLATLDIFNMISSFTNVTFVKAVNPFDAQLNFYNGKLLISGAAGVAGWVTGDNGLRTKTTVGMSNDYTGTDKGSYSYLTLLHEVGHALGLKHPGNYGGGDEEPFLEAGMDHRGNTVMSYYKNPRGGGNPSTYQWLDIEALQYLYGRIGDTQEPEDDPVLGNGDETYTITGGAELVYGGLGNDTIYGGNGNDTIYGGRAQADTLDGNDALYGAGGNDLIFGNGGNDTVMAGQGNDTVYGGRGNDQIQGGPGDDYLAGGGGVAHPADEADTIYGGAGNDSILGNGGDDVIYGEAGNDTMYGGLGNDTMNGSDGNDQLFGQDGNDSLVGGDGNDSLDGGIGNDTLSGGDGDDTLIGDAGDDSLDAGDGANNINGGDGNDTIIAGAGADTIVGGAGNDSITAGAGADTISAGAGNDTIAAGEGNDTIDGGDGDNEIDGGSGDDSITTGEGDDEIIGGTGNDTISAGDGADTIDGGDGDDQITGGEGDDELTGGAGADVFVFDDDSGEDTITDFDVAVDVISLTSDVNGSGITDGATALAALTDDGADCVLDLGGGNEIRFTGVLSAQLTANNFDFA